MALALFDGGSPRAAAVPAETLSFALPDVLGRSVSSADFRGGPAVVFFFRGFWCAYCVEQLVRLEKLKATDLRAVPVVAISPDGPEAIRRGVASVERGRGVALTHLFLADETAVFRERYGFGSSGAARPRALLLLDTAGRVAWRFGESHYEKTAFDVPLREALAGLAKSPPPR